ncbi:hypothetical protein [Desulfovibrio inopinatus]|uniref:hypothetical protein n=1 Tax=Desulfovibrio inopinatus TaxID=102109 RepID=UPI00047FCB30|nr:hypothetical protein [Desulfovibrio inopinatus]
MSKRLSFTKYESPVASQFRRMMTEAESTEDVKKFFGQIMDDLLDNVFQEAGRGRYEIIAFAEDKPFYEVSDALKAKPEFTEIWETSDLPDIVGRLAEKARNQYMHRQKNPEKTEAKIYHNNDIGT